MAGFKTHLTVSTLAGVGYGAGAYWLYQVPAETCLFAAGLCGVSGMLPDVDSDSGRPLKESLSFAAAVISTMLVHRFQQFHLSMEGTVLACAGAYLAIRFGFSAVLQRFTAHRGMFHSLPAALLFGEVAFLLMSGDVVLRWYKAGAVTLGYLSHLLLDEVYSVGVVRGRMGVKRSFGTALKLFGHKWLPNLAVYGAVGLLTFLAVKEPDWMAKHASEQNPDWATAVMMEYFLEPDETAPAETASRTAAAPGAGPFGPSTIPPSRARQVPSSPASTELVPIPTQTGSIPNRILR
jgi:hypothetical protein